MPTKTDVAEMISDLGIIYGKIKSEAETLPPVNAHGISCVSVRMDTANETLTLLSQCKDLLGSLLEDGVAPQVDR